jgi:hypothetical protein
MLVQYSLQGYMTLKDRETWEDPEVNEGLINF